MRVCPEWLVQTHAPDTARTMKKTYFQPNGVADGFQSSHSSRPIGKCFAGC
ncbi:Uncharacterised protein [Mycobacterium tuberculosis]|nr:Uncharacterised protein [Mycobacterium tuberculosis]